MQVLKTAQLNSRKNILTKYKTHDNSILPQIANRFLWMLLWVLLIDRWLGSNDNPREKLVGSNRFKAWRKIWFGSNNYPREDQFKVEWSGSNCMNITQVYRFAAIAIWFLPSIDLQLGGELVFLGFIMVCQNTSAWVKSRRV